MGSTNLTFPIEAVAKLAQHARERPTRRMSLGQRLARYGTFEPQPNEEREAIPCLWLVRDNGIYIMSPGIDDDPNAPPKIAYAAGHAPDMAEGPSDACDEVAGGDDFVLDLPLAWVDHALASGFPAFIISAEESRMALVQPMAGGSRRRPPALN